jgi:hypothetical protein
MCKLSAGVLNSRVNGATSTNAAPYTHAIAVRVRIVHNQYHANHGQSKEKSPQCHSYMVGVEHNRAIRHRRPTWIVTATRRNRLVNPNYSHKVIRVAKEPDAGEAQQQENSISQHFDTRERAELRGARCANIGTDG